jgi:hypothetical protein
MVGAQEHASFYCWPQRYFRSGHQLWVGAGLNMGHGISSGGFHHLYSTLYTEEDRLACSDIVPESPLVRYRICSLYPPSPPSKLMLRTRSPYSTCNVPTVHPAAGKLGPS